MRSTMRFSISPIAIFIVCGGLGMAAAQPSGAIITGSPDAVIADKPAARVGDGTASGTPVVEGSHDVFINGRPAAIAGGRTGCGGVVVGGAANAFLHRRPAAHACRPATPCN